jgi:hypothetical protein
MSLKLKNRNLRKLVVNFKALLKEVEGNSSRGATDKEVAVSTSQEVAASTSAMVNTSQEAKASTSQEPMANTSPEAVANADVAEVAIQTRSKNNTKYVKTAVTAEVAVAAEVEDQDHPRNSMMIMALKRSTIRISPPKTTERRSLMIVKLQKRKKTIPESKGRKKSTSPRISHKVKAAKTDHKASAGAAVAVAVAPKEAVVKAAAKEAQRQTNKKSLQNSSKKKRRKLSRNLPIDLLRWIRMIDKI